LRYRVDRSNRGGDKLREKTGFLSDSDAFALRDCPRALDLKRNLCDPFPMLTALEQVTKEAMDLPPRQRLALAEFLLESTDAAADPEAEAAWDAEIRDRIRAIDQGRVTGVAYEDVMRASESRLVP
jgi:putative addiction module component (TIGR02574 family)